MQHQHPSTVVLVRNGGKALVPVFSLYSNEEECAEVVTKVTSNQIDFAVATKLCSKGQTSKKRQKAKRGKYPVETETAKKGTPDATYSLLKLSVEKRQLRLNHPVERRPLLLHLQWQEASAGKKSTVSVINNAKKGTPSSAKKSTPTGCFSNSKNTSGAMANTASKKI